eukprot:TRINITY_DN7846_c0_g1_i1.p2 TRINITY_DN7846_c0_g1~~TRINITY_DN7846_c0_g1_i1.p2  ORF type:complete len:175 (-),score=15.75 TRINITY_DN7846_c0_g1_i1:883-1407(-)
MNSLNQRNNMTYESNFVLSSLILDEEKRLKRGLLFGLILFLISAIYGFIVAGKVFDLVFVFCEIIILIILLCLQYAQIVPNGNFINITANYITFGEQEIVVETFPFYVPFWINRDSRKLSFSTDDFKINKTSYPVTKIFDLKNRAIKLSDNEKYVFIIVDYFEKEVTDKLNSRI